MDIYSTFLRICTLTPGAPRCPKPMTIILSLVRLREFTGVCISPAAASGSKSLQHQLQSSRFRVLKYLLNAPFFFLFLPISSFKYHHYHLQPGSQQVFRVQAYLFKARDTSKSAILHFRALTRRAPAGQT